MRVQAAQVTNLGIKLVRIASITALTLVFVLTSACSSKKRIRPEELKKVISEKSVGKFSAYTKAQMRQQKLKLSHFESEAFENKNSAIDLRAHSGTGEVRSSKFLLPDGELFSLDTDVIVGEISKDAVTVLYKGSLTDLQTQKKTGVISTVDCKARRTQLGSGVTVNELECGSLDISSALDKELDIEPTECLIKPLGHKPVTKKAQYGKFTVGRDKVVFKRAVREEMSILGDIICNGENLGMGREERITVYTHEAPNSTYPAIGSSKQLFQSRVIKKSNGTLVYQSSDELLENLNAESKSHRVAVK